MEVNVNPAMQEWALDRLRVEYEHPKPSPHSTQLIYCLTRSYYDMVEPLPLTEKEILLFAIGFGMERLLLGKKDDTPSQKDGIWVSPDFTMVNGATEYGELKTTRAKPPAQGQAMLIPEGWVKQIGAYCICMGVDHYNLAVVHVIPPALTSWYLRYTQEELDENWAWIQSRLVTLMGFMGEGTAPTPFKYNMGWECTYCRYKPKCDLFRIRGGA